MLIKLGQSVRAFVTPAEALAAMEKGELQPDILMTDIIMPGMNGKELYEKAKTRLPHLKVIYLSGYSDGIISEIQEDRNAHFIQKPFTMEDIKKGLNSLE